MRKCLSLRFFFAILIILTITGSCKKKSNEQSTVFVEDFANVFVGNYDVYDTTVVIFESDTTEFSPQSNIGAINKISTTQISLKNIVRPCLDSFVANITDTSLIPVFGCGSILHIERSGTNIRFRYRFFEPQGSRRQYLVNGVAYKKFK